jgi:HlyD family secretion protein
MDTEPLEAQRGHAQTQMRCVIIGVDPANSLIRRREGDRAAADATGAQQDARFDQAERGRARSEQLIATNAVSLQVLDDGRASSPAATAVLSSTTARAAATDAARGAAEDQVVDTESTPAAVEAISADINDGILKSPRDGRVQYRAAQLGEVLSASGRFLNLVALGNVHMMFFLPTAQSGGVAIGADVRLPLDAAAQYVISAMASFVADVAQLTPKTRATEEESQKLMFRVKAQISPDLLQKHIRNVKMRLPGMACVHPQTQWPGFLQRGHVQ